MTDYSLNKHLRYSSEDIARTGEQQQQPRNETKQQQQQQQCVSKTPRFLSK